MANLKITSCKRASQLMSKSFEEKLSFMENFSLYIHLAMCKTCVYCFKQLKALKGVFKMLPECMCDTEPSEEEKRLSKEACQRIKSKIENN